MAIRDLAEGDALLEGWLHDRRDFGGLTFLVVRDNTGTVQVTVKKDSPVKETVKGLAPESVVRVKGVAQASEKAGGLEVVPDTIEVLSESEPELPIPVTEKGVQTGKSTRLDWRPLDLRRPERQATFRIQSALLAGMQRWLHGHGYQQVFTPCLLGVASEGGSEVFSVLYFDRDAYLRQDPQLHRQLAIAGGLTRIYEIGPAWRAEESHTNRHLCEHRVCAVETAFIEDETDTMRTEEQVIIAALEEAKRECGDDLALLEADLKVPEAPFPVFTFDEVKELLARQGKTITDDLDTEAEQLLWEHVRDRSEFYFVTRYPEKPFYVMKDGESTRSVDLYYRGLELSSGGQREHRHEPLAEAARGVGDLKWFTEHFRYGVPPHGGFAIGVERLTMALLGSESVKDCVLFPRDPDRVMP